MAKFGAKEVLDVVLYEMGTNKPFIRFDTLKTSEIEVTTEKVDARGGKGNPKIITWEINKEGILRVTDALISTRSLELISGMATHVGAETIKENQTTEYDFTDPDNPVDMGSAYPLTCGVDGVIKLAHTPADAAADIFVYPIEDDCGTPVDMTGATLSGSTLTLGENGIGEVGGKQVVVYYRYTTPETSETWTISSDKFAGTYEMVGKTVIRNAVTGKDEAFVVRCPNLKWTSNLNLAFSADGDPATTEFECEIMRQANSATMITMTKV